MKYYRILAHKSCPSDVRKHCFAQTPSVLILIAFQWNFLLPALLWAHLLYVFICQICLVTLKCWQISLRLLSGHISCPSTETDFNVLFRCRLRTFLTIFPTWKQTRNCLNMQMSLNDRHTCLCSDWWLIVGHALLLWLVVGHAIQLHRGILVCLKWTLRDQTNTYLQISLPVPSECSLFLLYKFGVAHGVELCGMAVVLQKQPALKKG